MGRRSAGISFFALSTVLISIKYITEAMWQADVGDTLSNASLLSLFAGIVYLVWGEYEEFKKGKDN
ncbi:hypothetical protein FZC79_13405 [Rossellomorea vietnamensis]|uniref:Uncharacterized protein n=1 Tax=Rossellomorea vietnamensis TaxID=218284 RepID=A0A5D4KBB4_9BACI|nr:hypothetical protein [Rossellomorea vietnamensis]TYR74472.1 hypothetical protein FZC79_13405 [Rossellomorea vietnamensis]